MKPVGPVRFIQGTSEASVNIYNCPFIIQCMMACGTVVQKSEDCPEFCAVSCLLVGYSIFLYVLILHLPTGKLWTCLCPPPFPS